MQDNFQPHLASHRANVRSKRRKPNVCPLPKEQAPDWEEEARKLIPKENILLLVAKVSDDKGFYIIHIPLHILNKHLKSVDKFKHAELIVVPEKSLKKGTLDERFSKKYPVTWGWKRHEKCLTLEIEYGIELMTISICGKGSTFNNIPFEMVCLSI